MKILFIFVSVLLVGCSNPTVYKEIKDSNIELYVNMKSESSVNITIFKINDKKTTFFKTHERFQIAQGITKIHAIADKEPYEYELMQFSAKLGFDYEISPSKKGDIIELYEIKEDSQFKKLLISSKRL